MDNEQLQHNEASDLTRREFMRESAIKATGLALGFGMMGSQIAQAGKANATVRKTRSYNPEMEYRRLGKTGLWVSAVCLGGHWKRVDKMVPGVFKGKGWLSADLESEGFRKNRHDVVTRCIESGINYIDACTWQEVVTYSRALKGRRDKMYLGFSWYQEEMRRKNYRTTKALLGTLDKGMREAKLDYADVWRITMLSRSGQHTTAEVDEMIGALDKARQQGIKVGWIRPITLWPFPYDQINAFAEKLRVFFTVEMSLGQMLEDVKLAVAGKSPVVFYGRAGGGVPTVEQVLEKIKQLWTSKTEE